MPNTYETSLDMAFIEHISSVASPVVTPSGWTINLQTHYLGGGRHFPMWPEERRWEIADIGVLVLYRQVGQIVRAKAALLQSNRLYADEIEWDEDNPVLHDRFRPALHRRYGLERGRIPTSVYVHHAVSLQGTAHGRRAI